MTQANLIIVSGPSGAGKSSLVNEALRGIRHPVAFSVSHTTRSPRTSERHGIDYFFVDREQFQRMVDGGEFLEWANVYGNLYGTARRFVEERLEQGTDVILDIDVQGAGIVKCERPEAVMVFILPPSFQVLRERLLKRGLDREEAIRNRLRIARDEIRQYTQYDYLVINDQLEVAAFALRSIVVAARSATAQRSNDAQRILETFGGEDDHAAGKHR